MVRVKIFVDNVFYLLHKLDSCFTKEYELDKARIQIVKIGKLIQKLYLLPIYMYHIECGLVLFSLYVRTLSYKVAFLSGCIPMKMFSY